MHTNAVPAPPKPDQLLTGLPPACLTLRSEMRLVHQLSSQLGRDIILASSSIETPEAFVDQLKRIGTPEAAQGY